MSTNKFLDYNGLTLFLSKLRTIFSNISHTHTFVDIENLQNTLDTMKNDVDVLELTVDDLVGETNNNRLPDITSNDEGAFLRVVNGIWSISTISNAEEASF